MLVLLDNGHGGLIKGIYQTPGKRSPRWKDGSQLYEGEFNRAVVGRIIESLTRLAIPYVNLVPEAKDLSLATRVKRANAFAAESCFLLSVHANAGGGHGFEVYTSPGETRSDAIATLFGEAFQRAFPDRRLRSDYTDSDLDKEAAFTLLKKTRMPAVLTENFFMDNEEECRQLLLTREGRDRIADFHVQAIRQVQAKLFS